MSGKTKTAATKEETKPALVPKLRFPEFQGTDGWKQVPLSELVSALDAGVSVNSGDRPATRNEIGILKTSAVTNGIFEPQENKVVFDEVERGRVKEPVQRGTIIISRMNTPALVGANAYVETSLANIYLPDRLWAAKSKSGTSMRFVASILGADKGRAALSKLAKGSSGSMKNITKPDVLAFLIETPSPAEQQKIAECLSSVDELIAAQARKLDALKTHKKGLMQQLFPREGETQPRLRFPEFQNAGEWVEEKLDNLLHFQDGFAFKSTDFVKSKEDATQVIRITDINNQNTNADKVYIPSAFLEANKLGKYNVDDGDLLLSLTGAAGFNFFFWNGGPATINQRTAKVTSKKKANSALLRLLEPLIHEKINARGEGQNNNLSKEFLSNIVLVIPAPDEQQRIADCLTALDDLVAAQTQALEALKTHKQGLMQQLFPNSSQSAT